MKKGWIHRMMTVLVVLILCGLVVFFSLIGMVVWKEKHPPELEAYDAIIVLGCQVKPEGIPSVQLQWRLDKALEAYQVSPCPIVVTGGQGKDEPRAESEVMFDYLVEHGVAETDVFQDSVSTNTRENLAAAEAILGDVRVLIVTSDYHLPRAIAMAEDAGLTASGIGSKTLGGYHWIKNHSREALTWVKYWMEKYFGWEL